MANCPLVDFQMLRGDSLEFSFSAYRTVNDVRTPEPMTGATITMTAKRSLADADPGVFQITSTGGAIVVRGGLETHIADVVVPPTATASLTTNEVLQYDIQVEWSPTIVHTLQRGSLTVELDVTQS